MAKLISQRKTGSVGRSTFQNGRHGPIERARARPRNPRTKRQQTHRSLFKAVSSQWRALTEAQRAAWTDLAGQLRGGRSGQQIYMQANATLVECGLPVLAAAPPVPVFGGLSCAGLLLGDTPLVRILQLTAPAGADKLLIDACAPLGAGIQHADNLFRRVTVLDAPAALVAELDLTAAYIARFREPKAGQRVVLRIWPMKNGFKGRPLQIGGLVARNGS